MPTLSPPVAGTWAVLSPSRAPVPGVGAARARAPPRRSPSPAAPPAWSAPRASAWPRRVTSQFTVAPGSTLRLQQLLAELGYLPAHLHPGLAADVAHPGGQRPGGLVHLALAEPAPLAAHAVDAGHQQRDHPGRRDELRVPERAEDRRRRRPPGVDRPARRRPERARRRPPLGLRRREPVAARVGDRLQGRRPRVQHAGQHRGRRARPPRTAPGPSSPATP